MHQLGPCALVGFSLFVLVFPLQLYTTTLRCRLRQRSMAWTEQRTKVLLEIFGTSFVVVRADSGLVLLTTAI